MVINHQSPNLSLYLTNSCHATEPAAPTIRRRSTISLWVLPVAGTDQRYSTDVEHLVSKAHGGSGDDENLWLSCRTCNEKKGIQTQAIDPETGDHVPLFNPRIEQWGTHFRWNSDGTQVIGLTPVGRATVAALALNDELRVRSRRIWVLCGWHPPG